MWVTRKRVREREMNVIFKMGILDFWYIETEIGVAQRRGQGLIFVTVRETVGDSNWSREKR